MLIEVVVKVIKQPDIISEDLKRYPDEVGITDANCWKLPTNDG